MRLGRIFYISDLSACRYPLNLPWVFELTLLNSIKQVDTAIMATVGILLSLLLLNNTAESVSWRYDEGAEKGNCAEILISESAGKNQ